MAFIQTYLVSLLMVGFSLMTGRLSKADGLDYEVYMILFMLQGLKLLWQACAVTERFGRYSSSTFTLESISAMAPFVADSFDTLKDIIFAGLCFMSEHWFLKIVGVASWIWLPLIYARLLRDEHCASHLSASYFPFDSAPTRAEAEKDNSVAPSTHPTLLQAAPTVQGATVREATSDSRIANFISASVEGLAAIAYLRLEGGSPFVVVLQIIVPLVQLLYEAAAQEVSLLRIILEDTETAKAVLSKSKVLRDKITFYHGITDEEAATLAEALKENCTVKYFSIDGTFGVPGAMAFAGALRMNKTVKEISFENNEVGDDGAAALADALKVNKTVKRIHLNANGIGDAGAAAFADTLKINSTLKHVHLARNSLGDDGTTAFAEALKVNSTVENIDFDFIEGSNVGATSLTSAFFVNKTVKRIQVSFVKIADANTAVLARACFTNARLKNIELEHFKDICETGSAVLVEALAENSTVEAISVRGPMSQSGVADFARALRGNSSVTEIQLDNAKVGDDGAAALADALKVNKTVEHIHLNANHVGDAGAAVFADTLKINGTLKHVHLARNSLGDDGATAFAEALKVNSTVESIDIDFIEGATTAVLASACFENDGVKRIKVDFKDVSQTGSAILVEAAAESSTVKAITIHGPIGQSGVAAFAKALKGNSSIAQVKLDTAKIGDAGAAALADALKGNKTVDQIRMPASDIGDAGAVALADVIQANSTLQQIELRDTAPGTLGMV
eukprot:s4715_g3.t1